VWYMTMMTLLSLPSILPAAVIYLIHCNRTPKEDRFPAAVYFILLAIAAVVACGLTSLWALDVACRPPAGNLCGLIAFPAGSAGAFVAVTVLAWVMTRFGNK